jgi:hypothetical protein
VIIAVALLSFLDQFDEAAVKVRFPADEVQLQWSAKSDTHRKLIKLITDRKEWAKSFQTIQGKLGILPAAVDIQVVIDEADNSRLAWSSGKEGRGTVCFNMKLLPPHLKRLDDVDQEIKAGRLAPWIIPPQRLDSLITHELTHVVCGGIEEVWLAEGLATYAAGDESYFYNFTRRAGRVDVVGDSLSVADAYPRGMAFFRWMEQEHGAAKLKEFVGRVAAGREKPGPAAAEVLGRPWEQILHREKAWSTEYISKFKTSP